MANKPGSNTGIPGLSFSWKKAIGLSTAQSNISRDLGIPITQSGRERKIGSSILRLLGFK